ncbi:MAG: hypothetical protein ABGW72_03165 [bacterium]|jgi:hypothetical protein|nr:hypothetical protein [Candidatus Neomarinimicrobiota bacterium]HIL87024.1 hypothetical protein [Candidatus Neomarinimicrobiota bacterium]
MIKKYSLILLFSISFTQNIIEDNIASFIENLDNKTLTLIIQKDGVNSDATLSVSNEKIYFDTLSEDGTIAIIDSVSIITYDFNDEVIIMETVDNTFLDIFNSNNLSKYNVVGKNIQHRICIIDYEFESLLTSIEFDMTSKEIISIEVKDSDIILFKSRIKDISIFNSYVDKNSFESWKVLDWRENE